MSERWQIGEIIDKRYEICQIKKGGMGIVFLCYDQQEHLPIALKTYQDKYLLDNRSIERFINEASTWIHLNSHPNIVKAYKIDTIMYRPYILLEYIVGDDYYGLDLHTWITKKALNINLILEFAIQVCEGMVFAQQSFQEIGYNFIHRDLKPQNILITKERTVKITDFGLTISLDQKDSLIGAGTPEYVAPEQYLSLPSLNIQTDIYAFGCILFEMICNQCPFTVIPGLTPLERWHTLKEKHLNDLPREPKSINCQCPDDLSTLILDSLAKNPSERIADFETLQHRLELIYHQVTGSYSQKTSYTPKSLAKRELINKGVSLDSLGRYQEAIDCYNQALQMNDEPITNYYIHIFRGSGQVGLGKIDRAIEDFEQAMRLDPTLPFANGLRANVFNNTDRLPEAIADYNQALTLDPKYQIGYYNRGLCYIRLCEFEKAIADFSQAIELGFSEAYTNRGTAYLKLNHYASAVKDLNQAIALNPRDFIAYNNRAFIYDELGSFKEALLDFETALQINPHYLQAYFGRGCSWAKKGDPLKAIADFEQALGINPATTQKFTSMVTAATTPSDLLAIYPAIYYNCGICYLKIDQPAKAKEYFNNFLKVATPSDQREVEKAQKIITDIERSF